jgi:hypothetical protein
MDIVLGKWYWVLDTDYRTVERVVLFDKLHGDIMLWDGSTYVSANSVNLDFKKLILVEQPITVGSTAIGDIALIRKVLDTNVPNSACPRRCGGYLTIEHTGKLPLDIRAWCSTVGCFNFSISSIV